MAEKVANKNKPQETEDEEEAINFPPKVLKRILALRKIHAEVMDVDHEYRAERIELEKKYREKRSPFFDRRRDIVNGAIEVEDESMPEDSAPAQSSPEDADMKGIPGFWLQALSNHPVTSEFITEEDAPALGALEDIRVEYDDTYQTFTLSFHFKENPFFTNSVLTKKYTLTDIFDEKSPQLENIEGSEIEWKEGKSLLVKEIKKKQKAKAGKNKGQVRTVTRQVPKPSFFHYFSEPKGPEEEEEQDEEKEEEDERIELNEEEDFDIAHSLRTSILPDAILWYTGEAREDDDYEYDEEGEEEEDEEGEEDVDEEEEEEAPKPKGKGKKGFAAPSSRITPEKAEPECKQT